MNKNVNIFNKRIITKNIPNIIKKIPTGRNPIATLRGPLSAICSVVGCLKSLCSRGVPGDHVTRQVGLVGGAVGAVAAGVGLLASVGHEVPLEVRLVASDHLTTPRTEVLACPVTVLVQIYAVQLGSHRVLLLV